MDEEGCVKKSTVSDLFIFRALSTFFISLFEKGVIILKQICGIAIKSLNQGVTMCFAIEKFLHTFVAQIFLK